MSNPVLHWASRIVLGVICALGHASMEHLASVLGTNRSWAGRITTQLLQLGLAYKKGRQVWPTEKGRLVNLVLP